MQLGELVYPIRQSEKKLSSSSRDSTAPDVRKTQSVVIVLLTRIAVINVLKKVPHVVHTILPEKYRFWKSNMPELYHHPISVTVGPFGKLLLLDYQPGKKVSKLLMLRLRNPVDVSVVCENISDAGNICYANGVCYIAERGTRCIHFVDIEGRVQLKVSGLRS